MSTCQAYAPDWLCRWSGIPLTNEGQDFEEVFYDLNRSLEGESELVRRIMGGITDQEIVYQKGEGPEVVIPDGQGGMVPRKGTMLMLKYFIAKRVELVLESAKDIEHKSLLDIGATSDLLFRYFNKRGVGLNVSPQSVEYMKAHGIEAVVGDAESLQFEDKSFDCLFCFQTLEHLENPVRALREFVRVMREKLFLTIPLVSRTKICGFETPLRGRHRWHTFEFSDSDFRKIVKRVGLRVARYVPIYPYGKARNFHQRLFVNRWGNHPWFEGFSFYELEHETSSPAAAR